jgi:Uma2 family endonuclease
MPDGNGLDVDEWRQMTPLDHGAMRRELLDGEPVVMPSVTAAHSACLNRLNQMLVSAIGDRATVSVQNPVSLDERSEPRPDIALLRPRNGGADDGHPRSDEILLLIEVADSASALTYDRGRKASYYAHSGISECWVVDLAAAQVLVHRSPASGGYRDIRNLRSSSSLTIEMLDGIELSVADVIAG